MTYDTTILTIEDPDDGEFIMTFKNPTTNKYKSSDKIPADATAGKLRDKIKFYYNGASKSDIKVTRQDLDAAGNEVSATNTNPVKSYKYTIIVKRLISSVSTA